MPQLIRLIGADHRYATELVAQLTADPAEVTYDDTARKNLVEYLVAAESQHEAAEELVLWPAVRKRSTGGDALVAEGLRQERAAKFALDALRSAGGAARQELAAEFAEMARTHMAFEEDVVLVALKKATLWPGLYLLGAKFSLAKRFAPTRPHPKGPDRRFGLLTKGMVTAALDRFRDKVSSRQR